MPDSLEPELVPGVVAEPTPTDPLWTAPVAPLAKPRSLRIPGLIALGVGGLGASGAVAAGLAATAPYNDPRQGCAGRCAEASRRLAVTSTVLAGVAVVGVGVGLALLLYSPKVERPSLSPEVRLKLALRKAGATATWRF